MADDVLNPFGSPYTLGQHMYAGLGNIANAATFGGAGALKSLIFPSYDPKWLARYNKTHPLAAIPEQALGVAGGAVVGAGELPAKIISMIGPLERAGLLGQALARAGIGGTLQGISAGIENRDPLTGLLTAALGFGTGLAFDAVGQVAIPKIVSALRGGEYAAAADAIRAMGKDPVAFFKAVKAANAAGEHPILDPKATDEALKAASTANVARFSGASKGDVAVEDGLMGERPTAFRMPEGDVYGTEAGMNVTPAAMPPVPMNYPKLSTQEEALIRAQVQAAFPHASDDELRALVQQGMDLRMGANYASTLTGDYPAKSVDARAFGSYGRASRASQTLDANPGAPVVPKLISPQATSNLTTSYAGPKYAFPEDPKALGALKRAAEAEYAADPNTLGPAGTAYRAYVQQVLLLNKAEHDTLARTLFDKAALDNNPAASGVMSSFEKDIRNAQATVSRNAAAAQLNPTGPEAAGLLAGLQPRANGPGTLLSGLGELHRKLMKGVELGDITASEAERIRRESILPYSNQLRGLQNAVSTQTNTQSPDVATALGILKAAGPTRTYPIDLPEPGAGADAIWRAQQFQKAILTPRKIGPITVTPIQAVGPGAGLLAGTITGRDLAELSLQNPTLHNLTE